MSKPTIPDVIDRFDAYAAAVGIGGWGSLHVVLADGNVDDRSCEFCERYAEMAGDREGAELAAILRKMSRTQRSRIAHMIWRRHRVRGWV